jgi:hypothetical protein
MPNQGDVTRVLSPSFFAGRYLIEIQGWDWNLHIGMSSEATPQEYRFQGGVAYARSLELEGRITDFSLCRIIHPNLRSWVEGR